MCKILTVDDSKWIGQMVGHVLKEVGHEVSHAEDGRLGLLIAKTRSFDLVLTDIHMPNMNGLELIEGLRALPSYSTTPILCLTMETSGQMRHKARYLGANGWLVKPFLPEQLVELVAQFLMVGPIHPNHTHVWL